MNQTITAEGILPEGMTSPELLKRLKDRILAANQGKTALERGAVIKEQFPQLASHTIELADQALKGLLVLPGTGPDLYFVGNPPKWQFNPVNDNEYTFHLNRMHHLKTMAEAYSLTGNLEYAKKAIDELSDWIDTNKCPGLTDETGAYALDRYSGLSTWRALEVGIRGYRTWPIIIELLADTPYFTPEFLEKLVCSIYEHCRVLYEISPLLWPKADHNHYLMENLGLMSFSCLFPEMKNSGVYLAHSQNELDRCMEAQCTPCGGQIEGCPSYHNGCVFWFAMRAVFARKFNIQVPNAYLERLEKMFQHSVYATRSCGGNFPWGDSHIADKETMSLAAVSCYMAYSDPKYLETALYFYPPSTLLEDVRDNLWRIPDTRQIKEVMETAVSSPKKPDLPLIAWQKDLNQVYIRTGWERDAISFMTACRTPVQNLHAHIDAGGFDLTAFGEPLLTDPGIYTYKNDENRKRFKSAFWHNCLTVNWKNMWEYQASWAYGPQKEGRLVSVTEEDGIICALSCHHNYEPAEAVRCLSLIDNRFLVVVDQVSGLEKGDSVQIHFHPDRTFIKETPFGMISALDGRPNIELAYGSFMETQTEAGKISTVNDVWHDSLVVHLNHRMEENGTFRHAAILIPHSTEQSGPSCSFYQTEQKQDGFYITFCIDSSEYRLVWKDNKLARVKENL
ncbi:heparinase II/III family protein [Clostridium sp. MCC353]|uniref:heparinase II/III family protein n=1 Tax=Clostridium sp. MCC353 TaxID=2592646 RepID=UPI001C02C4A5|nr:heparinase II/III family protein [Clostridium sp. MCC353]